MGEATGAQTAWGTPYGRFDEGRRPGETGHNGVVNPVLDTSRFHHFKLRIWAGGPTCGRTMGLRRLALGGRLGRWCSSWPERLV